ETVFSHYTDVVCIPACVNPNDCCAEAHDSSHLDNLSRDKRYLNVHEYSIRET
ncbi:hypothetical protein WN51_08041, partial [Melipona quadrifasciata]